MQRKKMLTLSLVISIVTGVIVPYHAAAANAGAAYELAFTVNDLEGTAAITGFKDGVWPTEEFELAIPRSVKENGKKYLVTAISDNAFRQAKQNTLMTAVSLPATLESIGAYAFYCNKGVDSVVLPQSLKSIGSFAFGGTIPIRYAKGMPDGMNLDQQAFDSTNGYNNQSATTVNLFIPGHTKLGSGVFKNSRAWRIIYGEGITDLPSEISRDNKTMRLLVLPSTCTSLESYALGSVRNMTEMYVLSNELTIGNSVFTEIGEEDAGTKGYNITVMNEKVKNAILTAAPKFDADKIRVTTDPVTVVVDSTENYNIYTDDTITLPTLSMEGFTFLGYTDGTNSYNGGDTYNARAVFDETHTGRVINAIWAPDYEASNVLYKNEADGGEVTAFEAAPVGRILLPSAAGQTMTLDFSDADGIHEEIEAVFDEDGMWINVGNTDEYTSVTLPEGTNCEGLAVLTLVAGESFDYTIDKLRTPKMVMSPRIGGSFIQSDFSWTVSDSQVASVGADGTVTGKKSGSTDITVTCGDISYTAHVKVMGEIARAIEEGKEAEYVAKKKPIIEEMNSAIEKKDRAALISVLKGSGSVKLKDINDFDYSLIEEMTDTQLNEFVDRILSYSGFACASIGDVSNLIDTFISEIKLGELNHLTAADKVGEVLKGNSGFYGIDLEQKYYKLYSNDVNADFMGYTAVNLEDFRQDYKESYVMNAFNGASGYRVVETVIEECADEIGYNKTHFESNKCSELFKELISKRSSLDSIDKICDYIDQYTQNTSNNGSSSGGGGGSRGSSSGSVGKTGGTNLGSIQVDHEIISDMNESIPETLDLFTDVSYGVWSYDAIQYLSAKTVISGYEDGSFRPQSSVSRAEFVKMIIAATGLTSDEKDIEINFGDVSKDDWYYSYIRTAVKCGIVFGDDSGHFNPDARVTREEIAAFIYRACQAVPCELKLTSDTVIADRETISDWAYTPVMQLVSAGIISGYDDSSFRPENQATREEAASLLYRLMLYIDANAKEAS